MSSKDPPVTTKSIQINYSAYNLKISLEVEFGKGKENKSSYERTRYEEPYNIEKHTINDVNMYLLYANEGPFVLKVKNVNVTTNNGLYRKDISNGYIKYKYGLLVVLDLNKKPEYSTPTCYKPSNDVERDGVPWVVMNNNILTVDQNGDAKFQWTTAKALDKGVKPTPEQELMGVEERHENSGMIYITVQAVCEQETIIECVPEVPVQVTRGSSQGLTRGSNSYGARVGYGSRVETKSTKSDAVPIPDTRFILPIRFRIIGDIVPDIKCAKDIESAIRVEDLQKNTGVIPDLD